MFAAGGVLALLVFAVLIYFQQRSSSNLSIENDILSEASQEILTEVLRNEIGDNDSDKDGLRDWEEALWSTDPDNPDTDGDGTKDGEEVDQNRDPLTPGPDDERKVETTSFTGNVNISDPTNVTEAFSQQFFADYMSLRQSGNLDDPANTSLILESAQDILVVTTTLYEERDIIVVEENTESLRTFGNQTGTVFQIYGNVGGDSVVTIIENAVVKDKPNEIERLDPILQSHSNIIEHLLAVPTPASAVNIHLNLINSISASHDTLLNLRNIFTDPLQALVSLEKYNESSKATAQSLKNLEQYFKQRNITFNVDENGYLITNLPF